MWRVLSLDGKVMCREAQLTVRDIWIKKHLPRFNLPENVLIPDHTSLPHQIIVDSLDTNLIQNSFLKTSGAACFSAWQCMCTSYKFVYKTYARPWQL